MNAIPLIKARKYLAKHFTVPLTADQVYNAAMLVYNDENIAKSMIKKIEVANAP